MLCIHIFIYIYEHIHIHSNRAVPMYHNLYYKIDLVLSLGSVTYYLSKRLNLLSLTFLICKIA